MQLDTIIRGGLVIDGRRRSRYRADVGIAGDRIVAVGPLDDAQATRIVDASQRIVAPGLIDVHNHSDGHLLTCPHLRPKTTQGFTTEILMADGISYAPVDELTARAWIYYLRPLNGLSLHDYRGWKSLTEYLDAVAVRTAQNVAMHVPYANVRTLACGFSSRPVDDSQMRLIQAQIQAGMEQGAVGLSTGLDYISQCFATTDELVAACAPVAAARGLYVTHIRYKLGLLKALEEAVEIGRRAGVRVHISHLKASTAELAEQVLQYIDQTARHEVDLSFDVYPYLAGSTMLSYLLPYEIWEHGPLAVMAQLDSARARRRVAAALSLLDLERFTLAWLPGRKNACHLGRTLAAYVRQSGRSTEDAICDLLIEENLAVLMVIHEGDDALIHPFLQHDLFMLGTDGIYFPESRIHPRMYGSAGRLLGPCVREQRLFSLEDAIYKASGLAAERFGLPERGIIQEQAYADLIVFDPQTITDRATYQNPHQYTVGIDHVLVGGQAIILSSEPQDAWPGRRLKAELSSVDA